MKVVLNNLEESLKKQVIKLPSRAKTSMSSDYRPDLDATAELDAKDITMFQELIGEPRWATEMGRVDIFHKVLVLSSFQASPHEGHLQIGYFTYSLLTKNKTHCWNRIT